ncbi:unnamed protein product [Closterium sp. NIES-54]
MLSALKGQWQSEHAVCWCSSRVGTLSCSCFPLALSPPALRFVSLHPQLTDEGTLDWDALSTPGAVGERTRCVLVQRSCGYSLRETLTVKQIGHIVEIVKVSPVPGSVGCVEAQNPSCVVVVDNCYGEFIEEREPTHVAYADGTQKNLSCVVVVDNCCGEFIEEREPTHVVRGWRGNAQLTDEGTLDWDALSTPGAVGERTRCVLVQRSCGYSLRETLTVKQIGHIVEIVKVSPVPGSVGCVEAQNPSCVVVVDNCYGEFIEEREPTHVVSE